MPPTPRSPAVRDLITLIHRHRLNHNSFSKACHEARKLAGIRAPRRSRKLPQLLPDSALAAFYSAVTSSGNLQHEIMLKLLFFTGVRNFELRKILITDVDLQASRIYISEGKGAKDRYVLFPESFRSLLRAYIATLPDAQTHLFESKQHRPYSPRRLGQIVTQYALAAKLPFHIHPHLFRHQILTWLKRQGLDDAQVQLVSGHGSRESLEVYTHLSLGDVEEGYQEAMRKVVLP